MTREEYAKRMKKHPDWAPGRDAIEAAFARRYPKTEPVCFESELHDRAAFGGDEYLDGFAVYDTGKGYQHIVTYGMSELYPSMAAFGAEYSKWGYEMTMKVRESYAETGTWALDLLAQLAKYAQPGPQLFPDGMTTDQADSQVCAEIVREKMLRCLDKEIPHGTAVEVTKFSEREDTGIIDLDVTIYCEKASHKGIIIGKGGEMLKRISSQARRDIEKFMGTKVYMETWVKVKENWRDNPNFIRSQGYTEE